MQLPDLKHLKAVLKLCRAQGVTDITLGAVSIKFGDLPMEIKGGERITIVDDDSTPSDEDMAFWSSQPDPLAERLKEEQ